MNSSDRALGLGSLCRPTNRVVDLTVGYRNRNRLDPELTEIIMRRQFENFKWRFTDARFELKKNKKWMNDWLTDWLIDLIDHWRTTSAWIWGASIQQSMFLRLCSTKTLLTDWTHCSWSIYRQPVRWSSLQPRSVTQRPKDWFTSLLIWTSRR